MRRDRNYLRAERQVNERIAQTVRFLIDARRYMRNDRPQDAWDVLSDAKAAIEGAMTIAKWATTIPNPED